MKTIIFLALIYSLQCSSQSTFSRTIGGANFDRALYLEHTSDGGYIICGFSNSFSTSDDIYLVKTDPKGNKEWERNYGGIKMDIGWSVLEIKNSGYLLHGSTMSRDTTNQDIMIVRLDLAGNVIWHKVYGNKLNERTTDMLRLSDGNYLLIGERIIDTTNRDSYVIKVDTAGNIIWEKTYGTKAVERTYYGAETPSGDILLAGSVLPYKNNKADILIIKIKSDGNIVWTKTYGNKDSHDIPHSFSRNKKGNVYTLTGYSGSKTEGLHDALFMQVDSSGYMLLQKRHNTGYDMRLMHAVQTKDDGFIATGFTRKDITKEIYDVLLLKYNLTGQVQWIKMYGTEKADDQGYWIVCDEDGGYSLVGYTYSYGTGGDVWLIKTNSSGGQ